MPKGCNTDLVTVWENSVDPYPYTNIDPYVTVTKIRWVSSMETDFTVTIAEDAPTEFAAVDIKCYGACGLSNEVRFGAFIQPAPPPPPPPPPPEVCPAATITSVTPGAWFAGKTYKNVTITGTGFAPILDRNTNYVCMVTAWLTTDDGGFSLNDLTFVNSTTLTATVKFPADTPTQAGTLKVQNFLFDDGGGPIGTAPVAILGAPKIKWTVNASA